MPRPIDEPRHVVYRNVPGYPGYRVGDDGSVWSKLRSGPRPELFVQWRRLTGGTDKDGYKKVILCRNGERAYWRVHMLVLVVFVGPCPAGKESRHLNGCRADNRRSNLNWSTHKQNIADKKRHGTTQHGIRNGLAKINDAIVRAIKRGLRNGDTPTTVSRRLGLPTHFAGNIKYGGAWSHVEI